MICIAHFCPFYLNGFVIIAYRFFFLMQATEKKKNQLPKLQKKKALIKLSKEEINSQHISSLEFTNQKTC